MSLKISTLSVVDHYDELPRTRHALYAEVVAQAELADRLGFDAFWIAEHHFVDYGVVPNPAVLLSHLAARTRRIKLGSAVAVLPFRDPRHVAEDYVMLDIVSGGRALLGVGSGYVIPEYAGFGLDFAQKHERFNESLAVLRPLVAGHRARLDGRFMQVDDVALNIAPVQPSLPLAIATGKKDTVRAIGAQGDSLMFMTYTMCNAMSEIQGVSDSYCASLAGAGHDRAKRVLATGLHCHVGATDADARATAVAAFDRYGSTRVKARKRSYEEAVETGVVLFGSPSHVADQLVRLHEMGIDEVLTLHNFGSLDAAAVESSMTRLMHEVMPKVRARIGSREAA